jgi:hypothetical protein
MSINAATITIHCDNPFRWSTNCTSFIDLKFIDPRLEEGRRMVNANLQRAGWHVSWNGQHVCPECFLFAVDHATIRLLDNQGIDEPHTPTPEELEDLGRSLNDSIPDIGAVRKVGNIFETVVSGKTYFRFSYELFHGQDWMPHEIQTNTFTGAHLRREEIRKNAIDGGEVAHSHSDTVFPGGMGID